MNNFENLVDYIELNIKNDVKELHYINLLNLVMKVYRDQEQHLEQLEIENIIDESDEELDIDDNELYSLAY